jgi:DNA-binding transcriptional ArsR family regulator
VSRIHFSVGDLAQVRMVTGLGVVAESVFALDLFGRPGVLFGQWRKRVRVRLGSRLNAIEQLVGDQPPLSELLWMIERPESPGGHGSAQTHVRQVAEAVFEFGNAAVVPYWEQGLKHLRAERDDRGRIAISGGIDWLLGTLHPALRWEPPVLHVPGGPDRDVYLDDRGLLLSPALFLAPRTCVYIEPDDVGAPILAFSTRFNGATTIDVDDPDDTGGQALGALVGHTRAAALQVLSDSCTTSELAQRLGISIAGASKHATVLRKAGLIRTARNRNAVLHTLTPLGVALLQRTVLVNRTAVPA